MKLHRVMVVAVVVVAAAVVAAAHPQRARQSPFAMGMRFLDNIRHGMTSSIQNFFGGAPTRGKEVPRPRPAPQQAPNLDAAPPIVHKPNSRPHHEEFHAAPAPHHPSPPTTSHFSHGAPSHFPQDRPASSFSPPQGPTSSFFKVVHDEGGSAPNPSTHGFSDESFHPDAFLAGRPPFQGTVEEDHLVSVDHDPARPLPLQHNHLPQDSFPPHKSATSFASFGNTASFQLGTLKRDEEHDGHAPLPRSILHDPPSPAAEASHHTLKRETTHSGDHPTVILLSNSRLSTAEPATQAAPPHARDASLSLEHHVAKKASASIRVGDAEGGLNTGPKTIPGTSSARGGAPDADVNGYAFGYGVLDDASGNQFFHSEQREDGETRGSYETRLPDGRLQTVTYVADSRGFHPNITYDAAPASTQDL